MRWWTLLIPLALGALFATLAVQVAARRDLGSSLVRGRAGSARATTWLRSPLGLTTAIHRPAFLGWLAGALVVAGMMGALAQQFVDAVTGNPAMADAIGMSRAQPQDGFVAITQLYIAIIATGYAVQAVGSLREEESAGRLEPRLAGTLSRQRWLTAHELVIVTGLAALAVVSSLVLAAATGWSMGSTAHLGRVLEAGAAYLPAELLITALALALFGLAPRAFPAAWAAFAVVAFIALLGPGLNLTGWVLDLAPTTHVDNPPLGTVDALPLLVLGAVTAALLAVAALGFRRRDVPQGLGGIGQIVWPGPKVPACAASPERRISSLRRGTRQRGRSHPDPPADVWPSSTPRCSHTERALRLHQDQRPSRSAGDCRRGAAQQCPAQDAARPGPEHDQTSVNGVGLRQNRFRDSFAVGVAYDAARGYASKAEQTHRSLRHCTGLGPGLDVVVPTSRGVPRADIQHPYVGEQCVRPLGCHVERRVGSSGSAVREQEGNPRRLIAGSALAPCVAVPLARAEPRNRFPGSGHESTCLSADQPSRRSRSSRYSRPRLGRGKGPAAQSGLHAVEAHVRDDGRGREGQALRSPGLVASCPLWRSAGPPGHGQLTAGLRCRRRVADLPAYGTSPGHYRVGIQTTGGQCIGLMPDHLGVQPSSGEACPTLSRGRSCFSLR